MHISSQGSPYFRVAVGHRQASSPAASPSTPEDVFIPSVPPGERRRERLGKTLVRWLTWPSRLLGQLIPGPIGAYFARGSEPRIEQVERVEPRPAPLSPMMRLLKSCDGLGLEIACEGRRCDVAQADQALKERKPVDLTLGGLPILVDRHLSPYDDRAIEERTQALRELREQPDRTEAVLGLTGYYVKTLHSDEPDFQAISSFLDLEPEASLAAEFQACWERLKEGSGTARDHLARLQEIAHPRGDSSFVERDRLERELKLDRRSPEVSQSIRSAWAQELEQGHPVTEVWPRFERLNKALWGSWQKAPWGAADPREHWHQNGADSAFSGLAETPHKETFLRLIEARVEPRAAAELLKDLKPEESTAVEALFFEGKQHPDLRAESLATYREAVGKGRDPQDVLAEVLQLRQVAERYYGETPPEIMAAYAEFGSSAADFTRFHEFLKSHHYPDAVVLARACDPPERREYLEALVTPSRRNTSESLVKAIDSCYQAHRRAGMDHPQAVARLRQFHEPLYEHRGEMNRRSHLEVDRGGVFILREPEFEETALNHLETLADRPQLQQFYLEKLSGNRQLSAHLELAEALSEPFGDRDQSGRIQEFERVCQPEERKYPREALTAGYRAYRGRVLQGCPAEQAETQLNQLWDLAKARGNYQDSIPELLSHYQNRPQDLDTLTGYLAQKFTIPESLELTRAGGPEGKVLRTRLDDFKTRHSLEGPASWKTGPTIIKMLCHGHRLDFLESQLGRLAEVAGNEFKEALERIEPGWGEAALRLYTNLSHDGQTAFGASRRVEGLAERYGEQDLALLIDLGEAGVDTGAAEKLLDLAKEGQASTSAQFLLEVARKKGDAEVIRAAHEALAKLRGFGVEEAEGRRLVLSQIDEKTEAKGFAEAVGSVLATQAALAQTVDVAHETDGLFVNDFFLSYDY